MELNLIGLKDRWHLAAVSKRKAAEALAQEVSEEGDVVEKKTCQTSKRATARIRRKGATENPENGSVSVVDGNLIHEENRTASELCEKSKKNRRRTRKKGANFYLLTRNLSILCGDSEFSLTDNSIF